MATTTPDATALLRFLAWLSPAFPVGSFSYSGGLEGGVHDARVASASDLEEWIGAVLGNGSGRNDAVLFCEAWRRARSGSGLHEVGELGEALAGSLERQREAMLQGDAFLAAARNWPGLVIPKMGEGALYCVAVGAVAGANGIAVREACAAFLHALASNMIQAGIRLSLLGQAEAVGLLARLGPVIVETADRSATSTLDDLGSTTVVAEIAAMRHETQNSRLFRS